MFQSLTFPPLNYPLGPYYAGAGEKGTLPLIQKLSPADHLVWDEDRSYWNLQAHTPPLLGRGASPAWATIVNVRTMSANGDLRHVHAVLADAPPACARQRKSCPTIFLSWELLGGHD
jgi:hypothetical protein